MPYSFGNISSIATEESKAYQLSQIMSIVSLKGDDIPRNPSNQKELVAINNNNVLRPKINIGVFEDLLTQKVG